MLGAVPTPRGGIRLWPTSHPIPRWGWAIVRPPERGQTVPGSVRRACGQCGQTAPLCPAPSPALSSQLEATLDLAERRRIRSAIRELQRQELERDEEALASKRFRTERGSHRQDNKENWLR